MSILAAAPRNQWRDQVPCHCSRLWPLHSMGDPLTERYLPRHHSLKVFFLVYTVQSLSVSLMFLLSQTVRQIAQLPLKGPPVSQSNRQTVGNATLHVQAEVSLITIARSFASCIVPISASSAHCPPWTGPWG
jgi:hypothetical protein